MRRKFERIFYTSIVTKFYEDALKKRKDERKLKIMNFISLVQNLVINDEDGVEGKMSENGTALNIKFIHYFCHIQ